MELQSLAERDIMWKLRQGIDLNWRSEQDSLEMVVIKTKGYTVTRNELEGKSLSK